MTHPSRLRRHWSSRAHKGFQHAYAGDLETSAAEPRCPTECAAQWCRSLRLSRSCSDHSKQEFLKMSSHITRTRAIFDPFHQQFAMALLRCTRFSLISSWLNSKQIRISLTPVMRPIWADWMFSERKFSHLLG